MAGNIRVIPRLDIKGPNLVKGVHLEGLRVLGKPWDFALRYYCDGADELIYIDSVASLYGRNNLTEIVEKTARNIFIPLTAGGGIRSIEDIRAILRAGADKVAINTAAVQNPDLIGEAARIFGSQCIVLSVQAKLLDGKYVVMTDNAREVSDREVFSWIREAVGLGAGEILLTSVDRDGTGLGYDIELIREAARSVPVPVIACGGCGRPEHLCDAAKLAKADALCAASIFHYACLAEHVDTDSFREEGNIEFIKRSRGSLAFMPDRILPVSVKDAKRRLTGSGVQCRNEIIGNECADSHNR